MRVYNKDTLLRTLEPERRENFLDYATILQVFNITKVGKIKRGCGVRLLHDHVVIHEGDQIECFDVEIVKWSL